MSINEEQIEQTEEEMVFEDLNEEGEELSQKDKLKKLQEKIKTLTKEKQEYLSGWQRSQADYANREKQISTEKTESGKYAIKKFIMDLLPVLDTYDAARSNVKAWEAVDSNWRTGIEYIFKTFEDKLAGEGLETFGTVGEIYDANLHEALESVATSDENQNEKISQIIMRGYTLNGILVRPAKVKVYKFN